METEPTIVVFRKLKDSGDVIALFPEIPGNNNPATMSSYMRVGQHGTAHQDVVYSTLPATWDESESLRKELAAMGYNLSERKKAGLYRYFVTRRNKINGGI